MKYVTLADWIANVIDAEDMAIRKRSGLPVTATAYDYHALQRLDRRPTSDYERGARDRRAGRRQEAQRGIR